MSDQVAAVTPAESGCCATCGAPIGSATFGIADLQRLFGKSYWTIRRWWDDGFLPDPLPLPGPPRWDRRAMRDFMTKRSQQGRRKPRPSERARRGSR